MSTNNDEPNDDMPQWTSSANERQPASQQDVERSRRLADSLETTGAAPDDENED